MKPIEFISKNNKKNILIFIHGFTSGKDTWVNSHGESFPKMLSDEKIIDENFDIAYFNYFTKLMDFKKIKTASRLMNVMFGKTKKSQKNIGIRQLSDFLKSTIEVYCSSYENIVLVAHSMGGLISKAYILNELNEELSTNVKLFLSLAVPHNGSNWANIGNQLLRENPQVVDLRPLSEFLNKVNNSWIQRKDNLPHTIYIYGQYDDAVDETSAIAYQVTRQHKMACDDDHFSISKPESKDSMVYVGVKQKLEEFLKTINYADEMTNRKYKDDGNLDDELFVLKLLIADIHNSLVSDAKQTFFNAEYMKKAIINKGYNLNDLEELYDNIERLYKINFGKFVGGKIKTSHEFVATIYEQIVEKDKDFLKISMPLVNANRKIGMLHQIANDLDKEIWWAKEHSINDIENFRRARDQHE